MWGEWGVRGKLPISGQVEVVVGREGVLCGPPVSEQPGGAGVLDGQITTCSRVPVSVFPFVHGNDPPPVAGFVATQNINYTLQVSLHSEVTRWLFWPMGCMCHVSLLRSVLEGGG